MSKLWSTVVRRWQNGVNAVLGLWLARHDRGLGLSQHGTRGGSHWPPKARRRTPSRSPPRRPSAAAPRPSPTHASAPPSSTDSPSAGNIIETSTDGYPLARNPSPHHHLSPPQLTVTIHEHR